MPKLTVQTGIPAGGPDTLAAGIADTLPGTDLLNLVMKLGANTADVRPYFWHESAGKWIGLGTDGGATKLVAAAQVDSAKFGGCAQSLWEATREPRYWILVREAGLGTPDAWLDPARVPSS